ncbi:MAG: M35 family metallo-endopeptidase [Massilia sp.]
MICNPRLKAAAAAVCLALLCGSAAAATSNGVVASIAVDKHALGKADKAVVTVTITNTSSVPQSVLKWHTPFGPEIEEALFDVTRDGLKVPYLGAHYKRQAATAADYFLLKPGASYSMKVDLSSLYDMSVTGDYQVRYAAAALDLFAPIAAQSVNARASARDVGEIKSAPLTLWIDGALPRGTLSQGQSIEDMRKTAPGGGGTGGGAGLAFNRCTVDQQSQVTQALAAGSAMASDGDAYMSAGKTGPRYTKWFGAVDSGRVSTIKAHFASLKDAFANKPVTVDCGCKKTYYAYVYPTQPYTIYVCKAFWTAPMTGTDSKGGTLVHEMSHFNVVASTDDWVYGQSGAASLAVSDPSKAIDNADSHEYFGENTPAQQ